MLFSAKNSLAAICMMWRVYGLYQGFGHKIQQHRMSQFTISAVKQQIVGQTYGVIKVIVEEQRQEVDKQHS